MYYDIVESGKRIKELRKSRGMTQEGLAEASGLSLQTIASMETGRRGESVDTLILLTEVLGCSLDYIVLGRGQTGFGIEVPEGKREFVRRLVEMVLENV